ncbi:hypothetical protein ACFQY0_20310 [Haloferula chungangensis]|uniref:Uncharacterized protein n=1 Tax=Haloferula chungangensis TaxID=1048331 RepID=A0ABW2LFI8_9BACT
MTDEIKSLAGLLRDTPEAAFLKIRIVKSRIQQERIYPITADPSKPAG